MWRRRTSSCSSWTPGSPSRDSSTDAYQGTYKLFQDRLEFGVASQLQTARAEGNLAQAAATVPEIQSQIAAKENQISTLLGRNPGPIQRGRPLFDQEVTPSVPAGLPSALLERRPDLRRVEQELVAANAQIRAAKALFFPQLSLTGLLGKASPELSALTAGTSTIWQAGGMIVGPLFQGGKIYQNYKATEAAAAVAKWQYEQAVIQAFQEVSTSLAALEKLAGAETDQARSVRALEKSVQISNDRYLYGLSSYFEILEAQQRLYPAQYTQAQIRLNRLLAYVQLYKALGEAGTSRTRRSRPPRRPPQGARPAPRSAESLKLLELGRDITGEFDSAESREWLCTNGIGGFASGTIAGSLARRYHGLLVAALAPPLGRTLVATKLEEVVSYGGVTWELGANRWQSGVRRARGPPLHRAISSRSRRCRSGPMPAPTPFSRSACGWSRGPTPPTSSTGCSGLSSPPASSSRRSSTTATTTRSPRPTDGAWAWRRRPTGSW